MNQLGNLVTQNVQDIPPRVIFVIQGPNVTPRNWNLSMTDGLKSFTGLECIRYSKNPRNGNHFFQNRFFDFL